eukprot:4512622-Amphidinium_carterae.2
MIHLVHSRCELDQVTAGADLKDAVVAAVVQVVAERTDHEDEDFKAREMLLGSHHYGDQPQLQTSTSFNNPQNLSKRAVASLQA